jgi:hypothetical protein
MKISDSFKAFMEQNGLEVILDNIDIRGIDKLKAMAEQWMQQEKAQAAQAQKNQPQDPNIVAAQASMQIESMKDQTIRADNAAKNQIAMAKITSDAAIKNKDSDINFLKVMSQVQGADLDRTLDQEKVSAEEARSQVDMTIAVNKHLNELENDHHERKIEAKENAEGINGRDTEQPGS